MGLKLLSHGSGTKVGTDAVAASAGITVPTGRYWRPTQIHQKVTTNSIAGNRKPQLRFKDAAGTVILVVDENTALASNISDPYQIDAYPAAAASALINSLYFTWPMPKDLILPEGYSVNWYDVAQISPSNASGTATASNATTMTDGGASWGVNAFAGFLVTMGGSSGTVQSNTSTVLTIDAWTPLSPTTGAYTIVGADTVQITMSYEEFEVVQA